MLNRILTQRNHQSSCSFHFLYSRWEDFPKMNSPRAWLGLEWVPDGRLIAVGGYDRDQQPTKSVEMLECSWTNETPSRSTWRK